MAEKELNGKALELFNKKNKITIQPTIERENSFIKEKDNEPIFSLKYNN